jgi:upstream activation factor subunit UAF30
MASMNTETANILTELAALRTEVKNLTKLVRKVRSFQEDPNGEKAAARSKTNGFNREVKVDDELRTFLGLEEGELISRSQVTKRINAYVKENGLKHPDNGRVIVMDDKLRALLKPPEDVQVTFLNLQKYISPHYVKDEPATAPTTSTAASTEAPAEPAPKVVKKVVKRPVVKKPAVAA